MVKNSTGWALGALGVGALGAIAADAGARRERRDSGQRVTDWRRPPRSFESAVGAVADWENLSSSGPKLDA
ncbi:MAG: hypothetical protein ACXVRM_01860 [Solirubrobacteraceae bacterium]